MSHPADNRVIAGILSAEGVLLFRLFAGFLALLAACITHDHHQETSLVAALAVLAGFIWVHAGIDYSFQALKKDPAFLPDGDGGTREFGASLVATSTVVLGLLAVFGEKTIRGSDTIKVAIGSLAADVLLGTALVGLLVAGAAPSDQRAWNLVRVLFNLVLWAMGFGLLCIATALIYE